MVFGFVFPLIILDVLILCPGGFVDFQEGTDSIYSSQKVYTKLGFVIPSLPLRYF